MFNWLFGSDDNKEEEVYQAIEETSEAMRELGENVVANTNESLDAYNEYKCEDFDNKIDEYTTGQ